MSKATLLVRQLLTRGWCPLPVCTSFCGAADGLSSDDNNRRNVLVVSPALSLCHACLLAALGHREEALQSARVTKSYSITSLLQVPDGFGNFFTFTRSLFACNGDGSGIGHD